MSEETTQKPATGGSQETKKQTVRISLPPKPAASPTIKIAVPPAGAVKAAEGGKAASTIKIPVPPKATSGVGITRPPAAAEKKEAPPAVEEVPVTAAVEAEATAAPKRKKARVKKSAPADNPVDTAVAAVTAVGALCLAAFLAKLGGLF
ncbi:MAG TPA: hypothetical protein QGG93_06245 [Verrucomicrobiota bacterium]|nr:hypothetical protein [Verrucomicrobiota bacterium]